MANALEIAIPALCCWRENRSGGRAGMQSVVNVLQNRAANHNTSLYMEATRPVQFTSISPPPSLTAAESEAAVWPVEGDPEYAIAEQLVTEALAGELPDITDGATNYYAETMSVPPSWASLMTQTAVIAGQVFFK